MERDSQRSRFFKAVRSIHTGENLKTMSEVERFAYRLDRATLRRRYGSAVDFKKWTIEFRDGRGWSRAYTEPSEGWTTFPLHHRTEMDVLRIFARVVHCRQSRSRGERSDEVRGGAWTGWQYAAIYMDLVRFVMGEDAGNRLKEAFSANRVRWTKPRIIDDEDKAKLVKRGEMLAWKMKDRKSRLLFLKEYPEAQPDGPDRFIGDWEDIYILWRP